jgi:hypothetical protein
MENNNGLTCMLSCACADSMLQTPSIVMSWSCETANGTHRCIVVLQRQVCWAYCGTVFGSGLYHNAEEYCFRQMLRLIFYSWRYWKTAKSVAGLAIVVLAIGIGCGTGVFTVVNSVLLNPLPYSHSGRWVALFGGSTFEPEADLYSGLSISDLTDYQQRTQLRCHDHPMRPAPAGKTYLLSDPAKIASTLRRERMIADVEEITAWSRREFGKDKIFVLGHSYGSFLGRQIAERHPKWLYAYIGVGQSIDGPENKRRGWCFAIDAAH